MVETVDRLIAHLGRGASAGAKLIIWAHNSHLGDARATDMGRGGELNVGQLIRERFPGRRATLVGFTTHTGSVTAASRWGGGAEHKAVRPSLPDSYERLFHDAGIPRFFLRLREPAVAQAIAGPHLERAIGVLYVPRTERQSHYFYARLPEQFDYVIHIDETRALEPLERTAEWERGELPETYPTGL
jgi:erythromycin esterase-like protein